MHLAQGVALAAYESYSSLLQYQYYNSNQVMGVRVSFIEAIRDCLILFKDSHKCSGMRAKSRWPGAVRLDLSFSNQVYAKLLLESIKFDVNKELLVFISEE